jgi:hypothetical protein
MALIPVGNVPPLIIKKHMLVPTRITPDCRRYRSPSRLDRPQLVINHHAALCLLPSFTCSEPSFVDLLSLPEYVVTHSSSFTGTAPSNIPQSVRFDERYEVRAEAKLARHADGGRSHAARDRLVLLDDSDVKVASLTYRPHDCVLSETICNRGR